MENNEIMNRLLENGLAKKRQDDSSLIEQTKAQQAIDKSTQQGDKISMSKLRVTTAKYKMYIIILVILIFVVLFKMEGINRAHQDIINDYNAKTSELTRVQEQVNTASLEEIELNTINDNERNIRECLNGKDKACQELPADWKNCDNEECSSYTYDLSVPVSFLQLNSLHNEKMDVDEKKILRNLNEHLIKKDMQSNEKTKVGDLLKINIGDSEIVTKCSDHLSTLGDNSIVTNCEDSFFKVPVSVTIEFSTIGDLTGFLYNVEKKMIASGDDRILYKIQSVSYDIIANDEPQTTDLDMIAYYYYNKNIDEQTVPSENNNSPTNDVVTDEEFNGDSIDTDNNQDSSENTANGKDETSFFKDLFSK